MKLGMPGVLEEFLAVIHLVDDLAEGGMDGEGIKKMISGNYWNSNF